MPAPTAPLTRIERWGTLFLLFALLLWGVLVQRRSAFLDRHMGDMGVYLRAGYAVLSGGGNLYAITDDNGWHYIYPPFLAILLAPFADPPTGHLGNFLGPCEPRRRGLSTQIRADVGSCFSHSL